MTGFNSKRDAAADKHRTMSKKDLAMDSRVTLATSRSSLHMVPLEQMAKVHSSI